MPKSMMSHLDSKDLEIFLIFLNEQYILCIKYCIAELKSPIEKIAFIFICQGLQESPLEDQAE